MFTLSIANFAPPQTWQDTSASDVHLESLKAFAAAAHGVALVLPRGAQGYALALCLARIVELQRPWS